MNLTHHLKDQEPAYSARFLSVLKFHPPGFAAVKDESGAFHINTEGKPSYSHRFLETFGFYEDRAAVCSSSGWYHILCDGMQLYRHRYAWCGNFQQGHCVVKDFDGYFFHIDPEGKKSYLHSFRYAGDFRDGYAVIQNEQGLHTHIDFNGILSHGKWFSDLDIYHKGFARAKDEKGWFHIDLQGKAIYSARYKNIEPFYNGIARVETVSGALYLIAENGEITQALRAAQEDEFHQVSAELVSYWGFYTLQAANELQLFEHFPNSAKALSNLLLISEATLSKLLRALQEMGFVEILGSDHWGLTTKGALFHSQHPFSLKSAANLWKEEHLTSWRNLLFSLKTGHSAFEQFFGKNWFEWLKEYPEKNELYHRALSIYAKRDYQAFCSLIDLSKHRSLLDVGGSVGTLFFDILNRNIHLEGLLLDLPNVIELIDVPSHLRERTKLVSADFFESWPLFTVESALLSRVLHDWPDNEAVEILKKVHSVLSHEPDNRIYIIENILNEKGGRGALLDLNMLVMTGGAERTLDNFNDLLKQAGFILEVVYPLNQVSFILIAKRG